MGGTEGLIGAQQLIFALGPPTNLIRPFSQFINATSLVEQLAALVAISVKVVIAAYIIY